MLSTETEIERDREIHRERNHETDTQRWGGGTGRQTGTERDIKKQAEAQREAASLSETPLTGTHSETTPAQGPGGGKHFPAVVTPGLTHLQSHLPHTHSL